MTLIDEMVKVLLQLRPYSNKINPLKTSKPSEVKLRVSRMISIPSQIRQALFNRGYCCNMSYACFEWKSPQEIIMKVTNESEGQACRAIVCKDYEWLVRVPSGIFSNLLRAYNITEDDLRHYRASIYIRFEPISDNVFKLVPRVVKV